MFSLARYGQDVISIINNAIYNVLKEAKNMKKRNYSLVAIYSPTFVWLLWTITIGLDTVLHYIACGLMSLIMYKLSSALFPAKTRKVKKRALRIRPSSSIETWSDLVSIVKHQLQVFAHTPLHIPLTSLLASAKQVESAIKADPGKENTTSVRGFMNLYPMLTPLLSKYLEISKHQSVGHTAREYMSTIEQEVASFSAACQRMEGNIYEYDVLELKSHFNVMKQKLAAFEQASAFDTNKSTSNLNGGNEL